MNGYQVFMVVFGFLSLAISVWAVWCVLKADFRHKAAWIAGCLFGFVGFGIVWTEPDDIALLVGVQIPPLLVFQIIATGAVLVKVQFPVIAALALGKVYFEGDDASGN